MLRAIIFDFDGVLGETEHIQKKKWDIVLKPYGIEISDREYGRDYAGKSSTSEIPKLLVNKYPQITYSAEELAQAALAELKRLFPISKIKVMPGTLEMLQFARNRALKTAVCSGKTLVELAMKLDKTGLADWFPVEHRVTQADANGIGKPDPGMCLAALRKLGVSANEAIVFEDTASGVLAAKRAGIKVVALPSFYSREHDFGQADMILWNGWPEVLEKWDGIKGLVEGGKQGAAIDPEGDLDNRRRKEGPG